MYPFYVAELTYPGTAVKYPNDLPFDYSRSKNIDLVLSSFESALSEVAIALTFFEQTFHFVRPRQFNEPDYTKIWNERRMQISQEMYENNRKLPKWEHFSEIDYKVDIQIRHAQWESGRMPASYEHRLPFMYAKTFVYALESIKKLFDGLLLELKNPIEEPDILRTIQTVRRDFGNAFPNLVGVRDSNAHHDERIRRVAKGKPIDIKADSNSPINISALMSETLNGNRFGATMSDGYYGEVEVSGQSLMIARDFIQAAINAFEWIGGKKHVPY
jgi:hypothetical protein